MDTPPRRPAPGRALAAFLLAIVLGGCGDGATAPGSATPPILYTLFPGGVITDGDLYLAREDGQAARRLTDLPGAELDGTWAPDGRRVAFSYLPPASSIGAIEILATVAIDGGGVRMLTPTSMRSRVPAWSPDGSRIAFRYQDDASTWGLAVVSADGSGLVRLAGARNAATTPPVWSADGTRLTFVRQVGGERTVWTVDVRDGTAGPVDASASCGALPRPSPDGQRMAFVATCPPDTRSGLYVANTDGSGRRRLAEPPFSRAAWAPDGRRLVFDPQIGDAGDVYVIPVEGGDAVPIAAARAVAELFPDWRRGPP